MTVLRSDVVMLAADDYEAAKIAKARDMTITRDTWVQEVELPRGLTTLAVTLVPDDALSKAHVVFALDVQDEKGWVNYVQATAEGPFDVSPSVRITDARELSGRFVRLRASASEIVGLAVKLER